MLGVSLLVGCGPAEAGPAPSATTYTESPLALGSIFSLAEADQAEINASAEVLIAECMKEQGFDYDQPHVADDIALDAETTPEEWAAQFGYGAVEAAEELNPEDGAPQRSAVEQAAYDEALYGRGADHVAEPDNDAAVAYDWRQEGCLGSAYHEATAGADEVLADPQFAALFAATEQVEADTVTSPEAADLAREWADCMADAGHPEQTSPAEAKALFAQELMTLQSQTSTEDERDREMGELREREVATALDDLSCQDSTRYVEHFNQLLWRAQAEVADTYRDEIDALTERTS